MNEASLVFILLTWQSQKYIRDCLVSVCALAPEYDVSIYVFDNGSTDDTVACIQELAAQYNPAVPIKLYQAQKNIGTTKSRNQLLCQISADTDYICILDSDTKINTEAIAAMVDALRKDDKSLIAAPRMFNAELIEQRSVKRFPTVKLKLLKGSPFASMNSRGEAMESYTFMPDSLLADRAELADKSSYAAVPPVSSDKSIYAVDYAISACWLMKREVLDVVGYLDERIFYAPEDVDYCARVRKKGYRVVLTSGASIYHYTQRLSKRKLISRMNLHHIFGLAYYFLKHRNL